MQNKENFTKEKLAFLMKYIEGAIESNTTSHAVTCLRTIHFEVTSILNVLVNGKELSREVKK